MPEKPEVSIDLRARRKHTAPNGIDEIVDRPSPWFQEVGRAMGGKRIAHQWTRAIARRLS